ncbi:hypothetical protein BACCOP_01033 [Phocaeicola coprocola DSM 17136]|uniref:Uncharacterized protein n=1 Tax=Phocaeicola coprocola DSM 17136 TaxID=470145 RepID=B3JGN0_9BACT|nr:hypothetical protein BACCOP_01033 [Phocaeicola coprocola DSM 17136]
MQKYCHSCRNKTSASFIDFIMIFWETLHQFSKKDDDVFLSA